MTSTHILRTASSQANAAAGCCSAICPCPDQEEVDEAKLGVPGKSRKRDSPSPAPAREPKRNNEALPHESMPHSRPGREIPNQEHPFDSGASEEKNYSLAIERSKSCCGVRRFQMQRA